MTDEQTICSECELVVDDETQYCPNCGSEGPWETEHPYDFDDVDFPVVVEYGLYEDNYGMWDRFTRQVFGVTLGGDEVTNVPSSFPRLKYTTCMTYWVITETDIDGPYLDESEARSVVEGDDD